MGLALKVECYSGRKADERPLRFSFAASPDAVGEVAPPRVYEVKEVLDQWYGPEFQCFKVLANDDNIYILRHDQHEDVWTLDAFRQAQR